MIELLLTFLRRWAVKEAAYKAVFPTYRPTWKELSYYSHNVSTSRKPSLVFDGNGCEDIILHVSVSHDGDYVIAQVLAEHRQQYTQHDVSYIFLPAVCFVIQIMYTVERLGIRLCLVRTLLITYFLQYHRRYPRCSRSYRAFESFRVAGSSE